MITSRTRVALVLATVALVLAACGPSAKETPTATQAPAPATATATPRSAARATAVPSATPVAKPSPTPATTGPKRGGTLSFRRPLDPPTLDPYGFHDSHTHFWLNLVYGRLMAYRYGEPLCQLYPLEGDLAESWKWLDDTTLDIKLNQGIRFQAAPPVNGRELVAEDAVASLKDLYARLPFVKPAADLTDSITAVDKYTLRIKLKQHMAEYLEIGPAIQPAEILAPEVNTPGKKWAFEDHIGRGNGPFIAKRYLPGVKVELERNPNYFRPGLPYLDALSIIIVPEEGNVPVLFRAGRLDVGEMRSPVALEDLRVRNPELKIQSCGYPASPIVFWRTDKPPFNDARVRRALSMAIDREAFNKTVYLGVGAARWSPVHSGFGDWAVKPADMPQQTRQYMEFRPDQAKALLAEAGYTKGGPTVRLVYSPAYAGFQQIAEAVSAFWSQAGVDVKLVSKERLAYNAEVITNVNYEDAAVSYASSVTLDEAVYSYFRSGMPRNRGKVADPELDKLLEAQRRPMGETEKRALLKDIQLRLVDSQYWLTLPQSPAAWVLQPYVKNVFYKTNAYSDSEWLRYAWLDR